MIPYSLNSRIRERVLVFTILLSFLLTIILDNILLKYSSVLNSESDILQTLESFMDSNVVSLLLSVSIPPFAVLVIIKYFYSKWLWKKLYRFHGVPNLNGQWKGFAIRDGDKKVKREVIVTIEQDWDNISIRTTMLDSKHMNVSF